MSSQSTARETSAFSDRRATFTEDGFTRAKYRFEPVNIRNGIRLEVLVPNRERHYNYPTALGMRAVIFNRTGRLQEAERVACEAVSLREASLPEGNWMTAMAKSELGECLTAQHRFVAAESLLTQSCQDLVGSQGAAHPRTVLVRKRLLRLHEEWKKPQ